MDGDAGTIFLACSANVCRSVYATAVLLEELQGTSIGVSSAGVDAVEGAEACSLVTNLVRTRGMPEPIQFQCGARELDTDELLNASLVLTFTVRQRGIVARIAPTVRNRLFTLLEASTLATSLSARRLDLGGLDAWVETLHINRPTLALLGDRPTPRGRHWWQRQPSEQPDPWDISDAHEAPDALHRERLALVAEHCHALGGIMASTHG